MAAARDRRCKQQGRCAAADALWGILWCAVWLWFAARTLGTARRILACQQFGAACRRALYAGATTTVPQLPSAPADTTLPATGAATAAPCVQA